MIDQSLLAYWTLVKACRSGNASALGTLKLLSTCDTREGKLAAAFVRATQKQP